MRSNILRGRSAWVHTDYVLRENKFYLMGFPRKFEYTLCSLQWNAFRSVYIMYFEWESVLCVCRECIQNSETYCALSNGGHKSPMRQNVFSCRIYSIYTHIDQPHKCVCAQSNGGLFCGWSVWVYIEHILHANTFCLMGLLWPNLTNLFLFTLCVSKQCTLSENAFCPMCSICAWTEWILNEKLFCVLCVWVYNALWARMRSVQCALCVHE